MAPPLVQTAASIPATTLFPIVLFNVIAGAMAIPSHHKEATDLVRIAG
jgi:ABC-type anion transport system duplicated permease subunit